MKLIKRYCYLDKLINTMNTPDIKVITEVRCAGKSKLLDEFTTYIKILMNIINLWNNTFKGDVELLLKIKDAYPKILIARTRHDSYLYEEIQIVDISSWLLQDNC